MGILIVWGLIVVGAAAMLGAWVFGLSLQPGLLRGVHPGVAALALVALAVATDGVMRLRARRPR